MPEPIRARRPWGARLAGLAIEVWPVIVVGFAAIIALGHVVESPWGNTFFYNGDSVVLPLIEESFQRGEPFAWIFSSQNFFFPEGLLFFLSTLFTDSARVAMLTNAVLNVVSLYILLRIIAHQLAHHSRHRFVEITLALAATFLFVVFVLLEPTDSVNRSGIATLFLFSTYYYGVILVGLVLLAMTLWLTRLFGSQPWHRSRVRTFAVVTIVIGALATFSDPLYVPQVVAPFIVGAVILRFLRRMSWPQFLVLSVPSVIGVILGFGLRLVFRHMFASGVQSYVSLRNIPNSLVNLRDSVVEMLSSSPGALKLLLLIGILLVTWVIFIASLVARWRPALAERLSTAEVFMVAFVAVSSASLLIGQVLTGTTTTRYLEPLFVFPLLTLVSVGVYVLRRLLVEVHGAQLRRSLSQFLVGVAVVASVFIVVIGAINVPPVARAASGDDYTGAECFDDFIGDRAVNGVGSFWTVRALDLYGDSKGVVLQADAYLHVFGWMINVASYEDKVFSYVVVDSSGQLPVESLAPLGDPKRVVTCDGYEIYDYEGTPGEKVLTESIADSVTSILGS